MSKVGQALNGKKTIIGAIVSIGTLIFAAATGQSVDEGSLNGVLANIIELIGVITGGSFLSVGIGHKLVKNQPEGK